MGCDRKSVLSELTSLALLTDCQTGGCACYMLERKEGENVCSRREQS